ncbi:MAG: hypothetical protein EZS28_009194 [Streblomastix strix]|uniref:Uncharacterized protein n=1 Tax=Streblomastix strix TaxID=222440 RepID=A0A5J4WKE0_9EUKA|nr:MAG: hypothetical protein EZS28_009194 [Streblomastix strix]
MVLPDGSGGLVHMRPFLSQSNSKCDIPSKGGDLQKQNSLPAPKPKIDKLMEEQEKQGEKLNIDFEKKRIEQIYEDEELKKDFLQFEREKLLAQNENLRIQHFQQSLFLHEPHAIKKVIKQIIEKPSEISTSYNVGNENNLSNVFSGQNYQYSQQKEREKEVEEQNKEFQLRSDMNENYNFNDEMLMLGQSQSKKDLMKKSLSKNQLDVIQWTEQKDSGRAADSKDRAINELASELAVEGKIPGLTSRFGFNEAGTLPLPTRSLLASVIYSKIKSQKEKEEKDKEIREKYKKEKEQSKIDQIYEEMNLSKDVNKLIEQDLNKNKRRASLQRNASKQRLSLISSANAKIAGSMGAKQKSYNNLTAQMRIDEENEQKMIDKAYEYQNQLLSRPLAAVKPTFSSDQLSYLQDEEDNEMKLNPKQVGKTGDLNEDGMLIVGENGQNVRMKLDVGKPAFNLMHQRKYSVIDEEKKRKINIPKQLTLHSLLETVAIEQNEKKKKMIKQMNNKVFRIEEGIKVKEVGDDDDEEEEKEENEDEEDNLEQYDDQFIYNIDIEEQLTDQYQQQHYPQQMQQQDMKIQQIESEGSDEIDGVFKNYAFNQNLIKNQKIRGDSYAGNSLKQVIKEASKRSSQRMEPIVISHTNKAQSSGNASNVNAGEPIKETIDVNQAVEMLMTGEKDVQMLLAPHPLIPILADIMTTDEEEIQKQNKIKKLEKMKQLEKQKKEQQIRIRNSNKLLGMKLTKNDNINKEIDICYNVEDMLSDMEQKANKMKSMSMLLNDDKARKDKYREQQVHLKQ